MRPMISSLALLCAISVRGQELAPRPEALPALQQLLLSQKPVKWVQTPTSAELSAQATSVTASITDVRVDVEGCTLSFKDGRVFPKEQYETVQTWQFKIPEIDRVTVESLEGFVERVRAEHKHPSWATKTTPTVFVLELEALPNHKFSVHRWSKNKDSGVIERDLQQPSAFIVFPEEAGAREAEKAMQNAVAFCASKQRR